MRNKALILAVISTLIFISSCANPAHKAVKIVVEPKSSIDFEKYENIFYAGFYVEKEGEVVTDKRVTDNFFLTELPKVLAIEVKPLPVSVKWKKGKGDFLPLKQKYKGSLIITGYAKISESSKSVIRKIKDKDGKKKNKFVETKAETIKSTVVMFDTISGKKVFSKKFTNKLSGKELGKRDFNFKALFENNMDKFIRRLLKNPRRETRYIIYR